MLLPSQGLSALVVDDVASNRRLTAMMLEKMGFVTDVAEDGQVGARAAPRTACASDGVCRGRRVPRSACAADGVCRAHEDSGATNARLRRPLADQAPDQKGVV